MYLISQSQGSVSGQGCIGCIEPQLGPIQFSDTVQIHQNYASVISSPLLWKSTFEISKKICLKQNRYLGWPRSILHWQSAKVPGWQVFRHTKQQPVIGIKLRWQGPEFKNVGIEQNVVIKHKNLGSINFLKMMFQTTKKQHTRLRSWGRILGSINLSNPNTPE